MALMIIPRSAADFALGRRRSWSASLLSTLLAALPIIGFASASFSSGSRSVAADQKPEPLPSPAELHRMFDDQKYQDLLAKLTRVQNLRGPAGAPYNHVEMELLRAETLLQLKQRSAALPAYAQAVKLIDDSTDPAIAAQARATQVLIKRTTVYVFTPKTATRGELPKPIDLLDMSQRKPAMVALLRDLQAEATPKLKAASTAKTLPPIVDAIKWLSDFRSVELAANGNDTVYQTSVTDLGKRAIELMNTGLSDMQNRTQTITQTANQLIANMVAPAAPNQPPAQPTYHKRGLDFRSTNELKEIIATSQKIDSAAHDFGALSNSLAAGFKGVGDNATKTERAADQTLRADYTGTFGRR